MYACSGVKGYSNPFFIISHQQPCRLCARVFAHTRANMSVCVCAKKVRAPLMSIRDARLLLRVREGESNFFLYVFLFLYFLFIFFLFRAKGLSLET